MLRALACLILTLSLAACARGGDGAIDVAMIGDPADLGARGTRLSPVAETVRAATMQGLVRLDENGRIVPAIAERWIVTGDGLSYIFRIREIDLAGGRRLTARTTQRALSRAIADVSGTTLGLDLAVVRDVRAMTGRVIEIRLKSPMPDFLQLLAQPELGIAIMGVPTGPMAMARGAAAGMAVLTPLPPEARGMPAQPDWADQARAVRLTVGAAPGLAQRFKDGDFAVLLGGTLAALPLADVGPLSRGTVRLDAPVGLFGLDVLRPQGFLASAANREALAMALDRAALIQPFNLAGWVPTTRIVPPGLEGDDGRSGERWPGLDQGARTAVAAARVARWKASNGGRLALTVRLPTGPGADLLFNGLASQFAGIGVDLARANPDGPADLALRDRVARYAAARWFLNQFHCGTGTALCSPDADLLVQLALAARDPAQQAAYLTDAENALAAINGFIPLGAPIRWSLVRSGVVGFADNAWASHPLFPLSRAPM